MTQDEQKNMTDQDEQSLAELLQLTSRSTQSSNVKERKEQDETNQCMFHAYQNMQITLLFKRWGQ